MKLPFLSGSLRDNPLWRLWPWFTLFIFAFSLFTTIFYFQAKLEGRISHFLELAAKQGLETSKIEFHNLPPALSIAKIMAPIGEKKLEITDLELKPGLFPPAISLRCNLLGGWLEAKGFLDSIFNFAPGQVVFELKNISLKKITIILPQQTIFSFKQGNLQGNGKFLPYWQGKQLNPTKCKGDLHLELKDGEIEQNLPLCKQNIFSQINGKLQASLEGTKLLINQFILRSGDVSLQVAGQFSSWNNPLNAAVDLNTEFRIPPSLLEENLMPQATMSKIKKNGFVKGVIGGIVKKPMFKLEN